MIQKNGDTYMQITKAKGMQQLPPQDALSKQISIKALLGTLATARQAKIGEAEFKLYVPLLMPYEMQHLNSAIQNLCLTPRAEGETAFPALATVVEAVRGVVRSGRPTEGQEAANRLMAYYDRVKAEGTTEPDAEMLAKIEGMNAKFNLKKARVIDTAPATQTCPHCNKDLPVARNIRFWEPEELEALAVTMRSNRAIAAANRASSMEERGVQA
jgi:hypothetical protein